LSAADATIDGAARPPAPRLAASLIIVDRSSGEPRLLMGRRNARQRFMPDVFVFPGGRLEPGDARRPLSGRFRPETESALDAALPRRRRSLAGALAAAAARETAEETGLTIAGPADALPLEPFAFCARAITPTLSPIRFDAYFFLAERSVFAGEPPGDVDETRELVELRLVTPVEALSLPIHRITRTILGGLVESGAFAGVPSGFPPARFYRQRRGQRGIGARILGADVAPRQGPQAGSTA
jgi:8-oxo-dGTP pyrophosphatase MutT (NUDIX family)